MKQGLHFAVVGAGMAGLSCATALRAAGIEVSVFDKSRGPSGRMSTRRGDDWQCDHGAQYFTARDARFRAEVARWQQAGVAQLWSPRLRAPGGAATAPAGGEAERFVGMPRMSTPGAWLAGVLALSTDSAIERIEPDAGRWRLWSGRHGLLEQRWDGVALALPAPQALPLLTPLAPRLAALAAGAIMRPCWAMMLRFDAPLDLPFDAAFVQQGALRWVARDGSKPGRVGAETWLLHATPEWSEAHLEDPVDGVAAALLQAFADLGAPPPQAWSAHRWRFASTAPAHTEVCAWQADAGLGLCGDWLNGGTVEGAWLSGRELAGRILQSNNLG